MLMSPGFTAAEVRELVHEYHRLPHGQKGSWLAARGWSRKRLSRWAAMVFEGDLDRGLIPREGSPMTVPPNKRTAFERARAAERDAHDAEIARLNARVRELEQTNESLGKAIGLLHAMSEDEPGSNRTTTDQPDS